MRNATGAKNASDGAEARAGEERPAEPADAVGPEFLEPREIARERRVDGLERTRMPAVHRAGIAQSQRSPNASRRLARARPGARGGFGRPHAGVALAHVFGDGQRIPDGDAAIDQAGHLAGGRKAAERVGVLRAAEGDQVLANGMSSSRISTQGRSDHEE